MSRLTAHVRQPRGLVTGHSLCAISYAGKRAASAFTTETRSHIIGDIQLTALMLSDGASTDGIGASCSLFLSSGA